MTRAMLSISTGLAWTGIKVILCDELRPDIDGWEVRKGMADLCSMDLVPEPRYEKMTHGEYLEDNIPQHCGGRLESLQESERLLSDHEDPRGGEDQVRQQGGGDLALHDAGDQ